MMLVAQLDEVLDVRRPAVDPVPHVVDVGELGVGAAGEPAALVTSPDLQTLGRRSGPGGPAQIEAAAVGAVG